MSVGKKIKHVDLSLSEAEGCVSRCVAKAKGMKIEVSVAVVDEHGHLKAFARMDGAGWLSPDIAVGKAFTTVAFRISSREVSERLKDRLNFASSINEMSGGRLALAAGGVLLEKDNEVAGAIGVSGATSEEDEECARAGLFTNR